MTVRGPGTPPAALAEAAVAGVGDRLTVVDDRVVEVADVLREVLAMAARGRTRSLAVVMPSWWPARWTAVVTDAAGAVADDVRVFQRGPLLSAALDVSVTEISDDVVVVTEPGRPVRVRDRDDDALPDGALIDVPPGVAAPPTGTCRLSRRDDVEAAVAATLQTARFRIRRPVLAAVAAAAALSCALPWLLPDRAPGQWRVLTEGRVAIEVPADWTAERITSGPGSARVRIAAPNGLPAVHLTQSLGRADRADIAESLRRAITSAPAGVFVDFQPDAVAGGRPAVTYRELRDGSQTLWAVIGDKEVRIAIGCQSAPAHTETVEEVCARAVRSARALG